MLKKIPLWVQILIGIAIGAIIGVAVPDIVPYISFLGDIFLRLLKMLIAPLVLLTLINGVCKMGDVGMLRKVGIRIVIYYMITSTLASAVGVIGGVITQPGKGVTDLLTSEAGEAVEYNFIDNMVSWIPENIFTSLSEGNTLQIIFFAIFMGCVLLVLGDRVKRLVDLVDQGAEAMLKMTEYVMAFSPIGIMALIADMVTTISANMMKQVIVFITTDWVCCLLVMFLMEPIIAAVLGRVNPMRLFKKIAPAIIVAASTSSSAATLPVSMKIADSKLGVPEKIYGFTLPLGNTCNMNGMAVAVGVISVFASNLYGYEITLGSLIQFVFLGLIISIGAAGVKGAGVVMSTVLLQTLGMPLTLIPILAAIWPVIDPFHTTANNIDDLVGTVVVSNSLGELDKKVFDAD